MEQNKKMYQELRERIFDQLSSSSSISSYDEEVKTPGMLQLAKTLSKLSNTSIDPLLNIRDRLARNRECLNKLNDLRKLLD